MENPFLYLEQRLSQIENLLINLERNFGGTQKTESKSNQESEILDALEVAKLAKVKLNTIYSYNTKGVIPIWSSETPILYKRDEIMEWLANGKKLTPRLFELMQSRKLIKK